MNTIEVLAIIGGVGVIVNFLYIASNYIQNKLAIKEKEREWNERPASPKEFSLSTWIPGREI